MEHFPGLSSYRIIQPERPSGVQIFDSEYYERLRFLILIFSMDADGLDGNSVGDNASMGSDFSDSLTELRAGGRNYFGRSVSCRIYNF